MSKEEKSNVIPLADGRELTIDELQAMIDEQKARDLETVEGIVKPTEDSRKRVIPGVNNVWEKEYDYRDMDLKFKLSIRVPNAIEQGRIQARREQYLRGMGAFVNDYIYGCYQALATIQEVGIDVPEMLADEERIYNLAILYDIHRDITEWLDTFRY